jgi:glycosyltransferase involved in cell wall biosynthesis
MAAISKFTIVTPSYNQAEYLAETIESVISQEGPFAIEYFILDGGSTDGSVDVIERYAGQVESQQWPVKCKGVSMHWSSGRDRGQPDAINKGLRMATGDVCSYLNSDDAFPPGALARVAEAFERYPQSDFIYGDGEVIDEKSRLQWVWLARPYDHRLLTSYHFAWNAFPNFIMQQATFWRRSVMEKIGYFDESLHFALDLEYWVRGGAAGLVLTHVRENLGRFRMIQGTKSLSSPTAFWEDQLELFRRYHGVRRLGKYFTYYYYNVAKYKGFDFEATAKEGNAVLKRWMDFPAGERTKIELAARYGLFCSALLAALALQQDGENAKAEQLYRHCIREDGLLRAHYLAVLYRIRCLLGTRATALMDKYWNAAVAWYRRTRIDYRYSDPAPEPSARAAPADTPAESLRKIECELPGGQRPSEMSGLPKISVIIATCRRIPLAIECIESVLRSSYPEFEIVVVDQDPEQALGKTLKELFGGDARILYVFQEVQMLSRARNTGMAAAHGDIFAFLDDDAVASEDWLWGYADAFVKIEPAPGAVAGRILPRYAAPRPRWIPEDKAFLLGIYDIGELGRPMPEGDLPVGANFAVSRAAAERAGQFSEDLGFSYARSSATLAGEDSLFAIQVKRCGYSLYYEPRAVAFHLVPAGKLRLSYFARRNFCEGVTMVTMLFLAGGISRASCPGIVAYHLKSAAYEIFRACVRQDLKESRIPGARKLVRAMCHCSQSAGAIRGALRLWKLGAMP